MKTSLIIVTLGLALGGSAFAQHSGHGHHGHSAQAGGGQAPASSNEESEWVDGEVRRIDREQGRVTLRHGDIRSLDMPPMTMVFHLPDARLIDSLTPGDSVRFRVIAEGTRYRITALEKR